MKRQFLCMFLVVVVLLMLPGLSQPQSAPAAGDNFVLVALVCGGPAPILGQLTSLTINGVPIRTPDEIPFTCSDTSRVTSFEPAGTDLGVPTCGDPTAISAGILIREDAVCSVSATVSLGAGPNPPTTPVVCTGSQSSLPLMITCEDTVNHLHLHLVVR